MPTTPFSLYEASLKAVSDNYTPLLLDFHTIPDTVLFDIYVTFYKRDKLCVLYVELRELDVFARMLKLTQSRVMLIKCFQALMGHGTPLTKEMIRDYKKKTENCRQSMAKNILSDENSIYSNSYLDETIDLGLKIGGFLNDASWYLESSEILNECKEICLLAPKTVKYLRKTLECCHKLLHAQVFYSMYDRAGHTKRLAEEVIALLLGAKEKICLSGIYTQFSIHAFNMNQYDNAYSWSLKSIEELNEKTNPRLVVEALSQASKSCVVKRKMLKAEKLSKIAVHLASKIFGEDHPKYAETLFDYGFYLLYSDSMKDSVTVYEKALKLKEEIFGSLSLQVAIAHEDLAYALYVHEYCSGDFHNARCHVEEAIRILKKLVPEEHLMLASALKVKALILEEIAIDHMSNRPGTPLDLWFLPEKRFLCEAEKLHKNALKLSLISFGEDNVQTAKHYGNLGRLYQSMKKYKEAEKMHLKAIEIKERLLGGDDYEVGLSMGHLASLYNYHLFEYRKAETLYIRSINISLKLFTESYSGLEYDYKGLMHVYTKLGEPDNAAHYSETLQQWKDLRDECNMNVTAPLAFNEVPFSLDMIKELFINERTENTI